MNFGYPSCGVASFRYDRAVELLDGDPVWREHRGLIGSPVGQDRRAFLVQPYGHPPRVGILHHSLEIQDDPGFPYPYCFLAACYAHVGRLDDPREIVKRLRGVRPVLITGVNHYRDPEHRELILSGLRMAAGEAG